MKWIQRLTAAVLAAVLLLPISAGAVSFPEPPDLMALLPESLPGLEPSTETPEETEEGTEPTETESTLPETSEGTLFAEMRMAEQPEGVDQEWKLYFGLLHAHTDFSDGLGRVEEAFAYAAQVENLDFSR